MKKVNINETNWTPNQYTEYPNLYINKKFKKISKRNLPNIGMSGWMEALADKVHKQGSKFHNIATFHTTIPT